MATQNVTIDNDGWQDLITEGSLSLTNGEVYTITVLANGESEVCIADTKPEDGFKGHPVKANINFGFTYHTSDVIWVRLSAMVGDEAIVVIS